MNKYSTLTPEEQEAHQNNFLIDSWSYSKISSFARNQKGFEMQYIFGVYGKTSPSSAAGKSYHEALMFFFDKIRDGEQITLPDLEKVSFQNIEDIPANYWKPGKQTPTIEECQLKAYKTATILLNNFYSELETYLEDLGEVLEVEKKSTQWLTVNGVDIPLPCNQVRDLVIKTKTGKTVIIDHKSKSVFSSDDEIALSIGCQAITYVLGFEAEHGQTVDEVWFVENKHSKNKDGSRQLQAFKVIIDTDTRKLYEALLYEPLRAMVEAVSNPDYVYLINESDNYIDRADLYDFWCRTQICEIGDFNVAETKKDLVAKRLKKIRDSSIAIISPTIIKNFQKNASQFIQYDLAMTDMTHEQKIVHVLRTFSCPVEVAHKFEGYSSNTYLLSVGAGVKVSSIHSKRLDIANALDVANVRISSDLVVHENKSYLAVDFAKRRESTLMFNPKDLVETKLPIGKDNFGNVIVWDIANQSTPHALVCGSTGSGKSILLECTIDYALLAGIEKVIIFDTKYALKDFFDRRVEVFNDIGEIEDVMALQVMEMNSLVRNRKSKMTLIVFDEFADAVLQSKKPKQLGVRENTLEQNLGAILAKGRSAGMRVMAATQRASTKVITGDAKVNLPVRICLMVKTETDSRVVLDEGGAESLTGKGDGLMISPEYLSTVRFQGYFNA